MKSPLEEIPGVGKRIAAVMERLGIRAVADLRGKDPEALYLQECLMKGYQEDRCALYVWRAAVYYAEQAAPEAEKLNWWYWKDHVYPPQERSDSHESSQ